MAVKKSRGRPYGYKLSFETKNKIRQHRLGSHHNQTTKDKISKSLIAYFKKRDSFSRSINHEYEDVMEAVEWIGENSDELDDCNFSIMTERRLSHCRQLEVSLGHELEIMFGHNTTPEFLLLLKEELQKSGKDIKELCSLL